MPWVPAGGSQIEFPYALWAKLARSRQIRREDVMDALQESQRIHNEAMRLSSRVVELEAEAIRLRHENEFMLRLINDRGTGASE